MTLAATELGMAAAILVGTPLEFVSVCLCFLALYAMWEKQNGND